MTRIEIEKHFHSIMKGTVSMKSSHIAKLTRIDTKNCQTELLTQADNYGKLERNIRKG